MRISDWSSDVCSSDLHVTCAQFDLVGVPKGLTGAIRALDPVSAGLARTAARHSERRNMAVIGQDRGRHCLQEAYAASSSVAAAPVSLSAGMFPHRDRKSGG